MLVLSSVLFLSLAGPIPTEGPAEPLPLLSKCSFIRTEMSDVWSDGVYAPVTFVYHAPLSREALKAAFLKEAGATLSRAESREDKYAYTGDRVSGGIDQRWRISSEHEDSSFLVLTEFYEKPAPKRWYRDAICPKPPAPLIEFPFFAGMKADSVSFTSLQQLMASRLIMVGDKDARIYSVTVRRSGMRSQAEKWLLGHGYSKTGNDSFFNPAEHLFEVRINEWKLKGANMSGVTAYYTEKKVDHPIVLDKF